MNIQANTTALSSSVSSISSGHLSVGNAAQNAQQTTTGEDTLTISAQGLSLCKDMQSVASEARNAINDVASKDDSSTLKTILEGTDTEEDDDDDSSTTSLTGLTDAQIEQLVADGTITQGEANAELSARKAKAASGDSQNTINTQNNTQNNAQNGTPDISIDVRI